MVALKRQTRDINAVCFAINNAECMAVYELILPLFRDSGPANFYSETCSKCIVTISLEYGNLHLG